MWFIPLLIVFLFVAFLAQEAAPMVLSSLLAMLPDGLWSMDIVARATVMVVPVFFFCAAMSVSFPVMLLLAFATGLLWDCAFAFPVSATDDGVFGVSVFLFGLLGAVMQGVRPFFVRGRWDVPVMVVGAGVFLFLFLEFLVLSLTRANVEFPFSLWIKISVSTMMSMVLAPVVFWVLYRLADLTGYEMGDEDQAERRAR
ncbi:hypothetical protein [Sulfuriroseicoccus oceanibius]|uniref:Rod shape-determining protein MreD n=1 Tax=Sulfuriroseicoccus oceanibius TaxID=2707525 RepID=A0A6B3L4M0_9BACT|nr:hypothetical protein [Sulfuriroseicoccus oceanibius]QQL43748.1 hypothetical protein G3M56_007490 [Sulfuriroseicoccus oceanibius]